MFCPNCGRAVAKNAEHCPECGRLLEKNEARYEQRIQLRCKHCNGVMTIEPGQNIVLCPFCGSKELLVENTKVTIERIKSDTQKSGYETVKDLREIDFRQHESQKDLELEKLYYEEKKEVRKNRREWKEIVVMLCVLFVFFALLITHVQTKKEREIASGKIPRPSSSEEYIGTNYRAVELELIDANFTNVISKPLEDLTEADSDQDGIVFKVMVNGNTTFYSHEMFFADASIYIYYHSLP